MPDGAVTRYAYDLEAELSSVEHDAHRLTIERDLIGREIKRAEGDGRFSVQSVYDVMGHLIEQPSRPRAARTASSSSTTTRARSCGC